MPTRTLAEALAEIRLSDRRFTGDLAQLRTKLISAAQQLEKDVQITVGFKIDEDQVISEFAKLEKFATDFAPVTKLKLDSDAALGDLAAFASLAQPVVLQVDTTNAAQKIVDLQRAQVLEPMVAHVDVKKAVDDLSHIAATVPPVVLEPKLDTAKVVEHLPDFQAQLDANRLLFHPDIDPKSVTDHLPGFQAQLDANKLLFHPELDPTKAEEGIDEVGAYAEQTLPRNFESAGEQSGSKFGTALKNSFRAVASTVGVAAGGFIAGALVSGFQRLTTIEDATASLTVQLGDATKAAALLGEVLNVVRGTPFNLDQFARAAANMVSFGVQVQKIPGYLRAIGEASASQGGRANEVAQRLSMVFGQITTANRISGEELLQFSESGVNALAILGNHFGKTTTEIRDMVSKGVIPAKQALDILSEGILHGTTGIAGATVAFEGTMAKLRNTLTGSIGGFKAATARFGVELIQPFKAGIIAAFQGATTAIDDLGKRARQAFGGIASSGFGDLLTETLKDIPQLVDKVVDSFAALGPALAPLAAIFGASGLGAIKGVLGPSIGSIIPVITGFQAALISLVVFTPELRDGLLPILKQLFDIVIEFGAVAGDALGKVSEALIPLGQKLIQAFGQLVPVAEAVKNFGEGVLGVAVPALSTLAEVIGKIPVPVLTALVAAFVGLKLITPTFGILEKAARGLSLGFQALDRSSETAGERMEKGATKAAKAMQKMEIAVGGAFSGMALASEDGSTRIVGAIGAIGTIAAGAAAGPWGLAAAGIGVAAGLIVGHFTEAAKEAHALKVEIDGVASSFADATFQILQNADALDKLNQAGIGGLQETLGQALLGDKTKNEGDEAAKTIGDLIRNALVGLDLPASGAAGGKEIVKLFTEISAAGGKLSAVPEVMQQMTLFTEEQVKALGPLIDRYKSVGQIVDAVSIAQKSLADGATDAQVSQLVGADVLALAKSLGDQPISDDQKRQIKYAEDLKKGYEKVGQQDAIKAEIRGQLELNAGRDEGYRIAVKLAEQEVGVTRDRATQEQLFAIQRSADLKYQHDRLGLLHEQIREQFVQAQVAKDQVDVDGKSLTAAEKKVAAEKRYATELKLSQEQRVSILDFDKDIADAAGTNLQTYRDIEKSISEGINPALAESEQGLTAAEIAAKNLAFTIALSKSATAEVNAEIDKLHKNLEDAAAARSLLKIVQEISGASSKIVNEKDLADREKAEKDFADTKDKILQLQADVQDENDKAAAHLVDLQAQRAKAVALGSTRGVEAIDRDIAHVFDKAHEKEADLADTQAKATELAAKIQALPARALTEMQQLIDQANFAHVSLLDLIVGGLTPEASAFADQLTSLVDQATNEFVKAAKADPENAFKIADQFQANLKMALITGGMDPATAQAFIDKNFGLTALAQDIRKEAGAAAQQYRAGLRDAFEKDPELGKLAKNVNLLPTSEEQAVQAAKARDKLQAEFDKQNIEAGLEIRPLTDEDVKVLQGMTIDAVTDIQSVAMNAASTIITTPVVNITAQQINQGPTAGVPVGTVTHPLTQAELERRAAHGVFREGGVLSESHLAAIVAAGSYRIFAEPETHGEGYIPLSPFKRTRSLGIMSEIADIFGYQLEPKGQPQVAMPSVFAGAAVGTMDADAIGRAVAHHTARVAARHLADGYDHAVHVDKIVIEGAAAPKRTAIRLVSQLAELALKRR